MKAQAVAAICLLAVLPTLSATAARLERSVSPTQQFIVYGTDALTRGAISELAEKTKANLLHLLRASDNWKTPIVLNLQRPQANLPELPPGALHFSQTGFGLKLQLDLVVGPNADQTRIQRELLRAILLERIYRGQPELAPGTNYVEPPGWLLDGVLITAADRVPLAEIVQASKRTMSLTECLSQRPAADSATRELQRAYSFALVQLLLSQPDGARRLSRYVDNLSRATNDPLADLQTQFPELKRVDLSEIWKSNLSRIGPDHQLLTFTETERQLDDSLRGLEQNVSFKSLSSREPVRHRISPSEAVALRNLRESLLLLEARANPLLRPTVREYEQIVASLFAGKSKGMVNRLRETETLYKRICARMSEIDDYLNWCEATKLTRPSRVFADYLDATEQADARPRRRDAVSIYLDTIENEAGN